MDQSRFIQELYNKGCIKTIKGKLIVDIKLTIGYTNWNPGFLFFREGREVFEWITFQGLVITQLDTNFF